MAETGKTNTCHAERSEAPGHGDAPARPPALPNPAGAGHGIFRPATRRQRSRAWLTLGLIGGVFACAGLVAAGWVDFGRMVGPCGFQQRFGLPCITCGMTRAVILFVQGRFAAAFAMQPAAAFFCSAAVAAFFFALPTAVFGVYWVFLERLFREIRIWQWIAAAAVVLAAGWAVTLARAIAGRQP